MQPGLVRQGVPVHGRMQGRIPLPGNRWQIVPLAWTKIYGGPSFSTVLAKYSFNEVRRILVLGLVRNSVIIRQQIESYALNFWWCAWGVYLVVEFGYCFDSDMMWCPVVHFEDSAEARRVRNRCRWNSESFYWRREAGTEKQNLMVL